MTRRWRAGRTRPGSPPESPTARHDRAHRLRHAAEPGDDGVGHRRPRRRAGALRGPRRRSVPSWSSPWPRSRGPATRLPGCTRHRRGCSTPSGSRARGWRPGCGTTCRVCCRPARAWWPASGGGRSRSTARRPTSWPALRPRWSPSRSTSPVPTWRTAGTCSPIRRRPPGRRWRPQPGAGAPGGPSSAPRPTSFPTSPWPPVTGERRRSRSSTPCSAWCSTLARAGPCWATAGVGSPGRPSAPSPCERCSTWPRRRPDLPIVGVGGIATGEHAAELLLAGAGAVQVGTATFADPRAPARVLAELQEWVADRGLASVGEAVAAAHRGGLP